MIPPIDMPPGFVEHRRGPAILLAAEEHVDAVRAAGLDDRRRWQALLEAGAGRRGSTARLELRGGATLRLKQLRRGGWLAPFWRERHVGLRRLTDNLRLPLEAARRGVPTPRPVAMLLLPGPPGLYRGWLSVEDLAGTEDLRRCYRSASPPGDEEMAVAIGLVRRMHDVGLEHRDLNLGNLLLRRRASAPAEAFVVDLDRARLQSRPVSIGRRRRALWRLERSLVKCVGGEGPAAERRRGALYALYARDEPEIASRLRRGRRIGRTLIALHRLGWRS